ncbi:MAG TPA: hypothetical protein EYP85_10545 [Armatimonadetes bacterium]|nr:hypothetical protein [Armatimonadota bacterium]
MRPFPWLVGALVGVISTASGEGKVPYDFFPLSYWVGPPANEQTPERYAEIAECHFTLVFNGDPDLAHRFGLKCLVADPRVSAAVRNPGAETDPGLDAAVAQWAQHPAFFGFYLKDEPHSRDFPALAHVNQYLLAKAPHSVPYINLFPTYATQEQLGNETYEEHVEQFLTTVKPRVLSYDHYALLKDHDRPDFFLNLEIIRRASLRHGVPFWYILLSTPHGGYRDPSEGDLRWQVYSALAYGAKGLLYFTYWTPAHANYRHGILSPTGERTEHYWMVQRINAEVKHLGPTLLRLTSRAVYHTPPIPEGASAQPEKALVRKVTGGELVLGELTDEAGQQYLFLVNRNHDEPVQVQVTLQPNLAAVSRLSKLTGEHQPLALASSEDGPTFTLQLAPGDGTLLLVR